MYFYLLYLRPEDDLLVFVRTPGPQVLSTKLEDFSEFGKRLEKVSTGRVIWYDSAGELDRSFTSPQTNAVPDGSVYRNTSKYYI